MYNNLQPNLINKYNENLNAFLSANVLDDMLQSYDNLMGVSKFYISSIIDICDCDENRRLLNNIIEIKTPYLIINNIDLITITNLKNKTYTVIQTQPSKYINSHRYNSTGTSLSMKF
jgi:hypothetical protein